MTQLDTTRPDDFAATVAHIVSSALAQGAHYRNLLEQAAKAFAEGDDAQGKAVVARFTQPDASSSIRVAVDAALPREAADPTMQGFG